jgi:anti-sigma factor RsiW
MEREEFHLSDQELLQSADGELSTRAGGRIEAHLAACWSCRARLRSLEDAATDFARIRQQTLDSQLPPALLADEGPRAMLKAQLAATSGGEASSRWSSWILAAACLGAIGISTALYLTIGVARSGAVVFAAPRANLTPGAVVLLSKEQVCSTERANNRAVPVSLRRRVFEAYGISNADARQYEVDYLITPALGGSDDIRNLWPQSYSSTVWNAHIKDALEEHLRAMVCAGDLDLETAQRDLAQDWIAAFKKYFHTDRPVEIRQ